MQQYLKLVRQQISQFQEVKLNRIPREQNIATNQLAKSASTDASNDETEVVKQLSIQTIEVNLINIETSWMTQIISYLQEGILPSDRHKARRLKVRESRFIIL